MENGDAANPFGIEGGNGSIPRIDPGTIGKESTGTGNADSGSNSTSAGTAPAIGTGKQRGRPPGSKNRASGVAGTSTQKTSVRVDRDAISAILFSAHAMLASLTKTPELQLDASEAKTLAEAAAKVAEHYDVTADPKTVAWANLMMTVGMVYGTRFIAISARKKNDRRKRAHSNVAPIRGDIQTDFSASPMGRLEPFDPPTKQ